MELVLQFSIKVLVHNIWNKKSFFISTLSSLLDFNGVQGLYLIHLQSVYTINGPPIDNTRVYYIVHCYSVGIDMQACCVQVVYQCMTVTVDKNS